MRFRTRAFLLTFLPAAFVLALSFLMVQHYVENTVRDGLRNSLRQSQRNVAQQRDANSLQNRQMLKAFGSDDSLQAAVQNFRPAAVSSPAPANQAAPLALGEGSATAKTAEPPHSDPAAGAQIPTQGTDEAADENYIRIAPDSLQAQLLRFGVRAGVDFLMVSGPDWKPFAGAVRAGGGSAELVPLFAFPQPDEGGLLLFRGEPFQTGTVRLQARGATIGYLTLGERLKLSTFATPAVLLHDGWIMQSDILRSRISDIGAKVRQCPEHAECNLKLNGVEWLSLPILYDADNGWTLYSLVNVDEATGPVDKMLRRIFLSVAVLSLITTLLCSMVWSRAIVQPISVMVAHLHDAAKTGNLPEFEDKLSNVREIRDLAASYNRAAASVRKGQSELHDAYVQFVFALANALDARDCYTAGHSKRVSDLACTIARAMGLSEAEVKHLQIGALLHDIGKIGIPDAVLHHTGKLSIEEYRTIKKHPQIGRRILQGVQGFAMYLPAIELHHENWDGSGYPRRQRGEETPLDARIIHVADAYDAMTTDRSYRKGMTVDRALDILAEHAGTQFDPDVVAALLHLPSFPKAEAASHAVPPLTSSLSPAAAGQPAELAGATAQPAMGNAYSVAAADALASSNLPVC